MASRGLVSATAQKSHTLFREAQERAATAVELSILDNRRLTDN
jgi:hypothetical protein